MGQNTMPLSQQPRHFIVKHDLESLVALPNFIWRTGVTEAPKQFDQVKPGARWIAFAYTSSDKRERPLSQITGFYECTKIGCYREIPLPEKAFEERGWTERKAWMIEGDLYGAQPKQATDVPPIDQLLGRKHFKGQTLVPITADEYEHIRKETLARQINPTT